MKGRVVEIEYAKGWGRVLLDDGRTLTFDVSACRQGVPDRDARVTVTVVPARMGGEKIGSLAIETSWTALPDKHPYLVADGDVWIVLDGEVVQALGDGTDRWERPHGETGIALLEANANVVSHTTAWHASTYAGSTSAPEHGGRDVRIRDLQPAPLSLRDIAPFRDWADSCVEDLIDFDDDELSPNEAARDEILYDDLVMMIHLARELGSRKQINEVKLARLRRHVGR